VVTKEEFDPQISQTNADFEGKEQRRVVARMNKINRMKSVF